MGKDESKASKNSSILNTTRDGKRQSGPSNALFLSPRPFREFNSADWKEYVESLYEKHGARKTEAPKAWNFRLSTKGTPVLTVRGRNPKFLTEAEVAEFRKVSGFSASQTFIFLKDKGIRVVPDEGAGLTLSNPSKSG